MSIFNPYSFNKRIGWLFFLPRMGIKTFFSKYWIDKTGNSLTDQSGNKLIFKTRYQ